VSRIGQVLRQIEASYRQKEEAGLLLHLDPSFQQVSLFKEQIRHDFTTFSEINVTMKIIRVDKTPSEISTSIYWEGTWKEKTGDTLLPPSASPLHQSGHALFLWNLDEVPRLLEIRGDAPWGNKVLRNE